MTRITRFSLTIAITLACALVCIAQEQPKESANAQTTENASTTENAVGPIDGEGTVGKIPKFTGTNSISDSIITESSGRLGVSTPVAPQAKLHVHVPGLPSLPGNGTNATPLFQTSGGKGGNTTGADADTQTGGAGASIFLVAGQGGDASSGSVRGSGGSITLQPGGSGGGTGTAGASGKVLLAPNGVGGVIIGISEGIAAKLEVQGGSTVGIHGESNSGAGVSGKSGSGRGVEGHSAVSSGVFGEGAIGVRGNSASGNGTGVFGESTGGYGVHGRSESDNGVAGFSTSGNGVHGNSSSGYGVSGYSFTGNGVYGQSGTGNAGEFEGRVQVNGALTSTGNVNIGGNELYGATTRQMINLFETSYGIGVQNSTFYFRVADTGNYNWYMGGVHNNAANNAGGGTRLMRLDSSGNLTLKGNEFFGNTTRQMINLYDAKFGIGVQNSTEYFRSAAGFAWFKGGVHNDTQNDPGTGGALMMRLNSNGSLFTTGSVNPASDRQMKANFAAVNPRSVLARLAAIPIQTWNYKAEDHSVRHIGPVAQDFRAAFNLGADDKHIATVDADGVTMAAIQGLYQMMLEKDQETQEMMREKDRQIEQLQSLRAENETIRAQAEALRLANEAIKARLDALERAVTKSAVN